MKNSIFSKLTQDKNINQINMLCHEAGLYDLYLYDTNDEEESAKVLFFADSVDKGTDLFLLMNKAEEIANILGIDSEQVSLEPFDRIADEFRETVRESAQPYTIQNKPNLSKCYSQIEIDEGSLPTQSIQSPQKSLENFWNIQHKRKREGSPMDEDISLRIVSCLKQQGLWSHVVEHPDALLIVWQELLAQKSSSTVPSQ